MRRSGPTRDERDLFDELIRIAGETPFRPPAEEARIRELLALAHRHALAGLVATRLLERSGEIILGTERQGDRYWLRVRKAIRS